MTLICRRPHMDKRVFVNLDMTVNIKGSLIKQKRKKISHFKRYPVICYILSGTMTKLPLCLMPV